MRTSLTGCLGSIAVLVCSGALAGDNSDVTNETVTLDKLKVIETINVTSAKEIDGSKSDKVDYEVLKILKAADQESDATSNTTSEKLEIIEQINVTARKEIDETNDIHVDAKVEKVLKEAQEAGKTSDSELEAHQTLTRLEKVHAKKFKREIGNAELIEIDSSEELKSAKLTESKLVLKGHKLDSFTGDEKLTKTDTNEEEKEAK